MRENTLGEFSTPLQQCWIKMLYCTVLPHVLPSGIWAYMYNFVYTVYYVYILYTVFILSLPVSISYWIGGSDAKITIFGMSYIHLKKNIFKHKNTYKNNNEGL